MLFTPGPPSYKRKRPSGGLDCEENPSLSEVGLAEASPLTLGVDGTRQVSLSFSSGHPGGAFQQDHVTLSPEYLVYTTNCALTWILTVLFNLHGKTLHFSFIFAFYLQIPFRKKRKRKEAVVVAAVVC